MTKQYEYGGNICFVCEYMVINRDGWLETEEVIDLETAEARIIDQADDFLKDYYGFSPKDFATVSIELDWHYYPDEAERNGND